MSTAPGNWSPLASLPGMDDSDFERWASLLEKRTGVVVPLTRKTFLVTSVRGRMRETGHTQFRGVFFGPAEDSGRRDRVDHAGRPPDGARDAFFPPPAVVRSDRERLAAEGDRRGARRAARLERGLLQRRGSLHAGDGAGPQPRRGQDREIAEGVFRRDRYRRQSTGFGRWSCRALPAAEDRGDSRGISRTATANRWMATRSGSCESLRKRVGFAQFNLLDVARAPMKRLDLIFCQNVLIYFARERRRELLATFANLLKPGGLLVLGSGEVTNFAHAKLRRMENRNVLAFLRAKLRDTAMKLQDEHRFHYPQLGQAGTRRDAETGAPGARGVRRGSGRHRA